MNMQNASKALVLRHVPHEHLGTLSNTLKANNLDYEYVDLYEDRNPDVRLDNTSTLIILGGPMNVYETEKHPFLELEDRLIKEAMTREIPILGICLGAQLLAKALGGRVMKNKEKEIGWYPLQTTDDADSDDLFRHFNSEETVFQWHGDTFEIPKGAVHLATSPLCLNQAFRYGTNVYGLQFHLEVTPEMIWEWLDVSGNKEEIISLKGKVDPETIKAHVFEHINNLKMLAEKAFGGFCGLIEK
jgi:GMP synthase-like glutamine amidotransferase